jgi:glycosyltransferase involved in cell wall biosynthesis
MTVQPTSHAPHPLVFAGPFPPPIGGYTRIAENFAAAWREETDSELVVIDTSPNRDKHEPGVGVRDLFRGIRIGTEMWWSVTRSRALVVFATGLFYRKLRPLIDYLHRVRGGPTLIWFSGGVVHESFRQVTAGERSRIVSSLQSVDRVIVETKQVRDGLREEGVEDILALPNPRFVDWAALPPLGLPEERDGLRVLYFSRVVAEKGVFVLAEAVRRARDRGVSVTYDIYGPVADSEQDTLQEVCDGESIRYRGVFDGDAIKLMTNYDIVGLPTWFEGEGHPGVIVEAMVAGRPVISTYHKAIPEIVDDGENGLLVEPKNAGQLTCALCRLAQNPGQIESMGRAHRDRLHQHDAAESVRRIYEMIRNIREKA